MMSPDEKYESVLPIGEECIQKEELMSLFKYNKQHPVCYDGFEPSGRMHIAQGVMKTINVNKLTTAGCKVKILIADWHAQLNHKMGGDIQKIRVVGQYLIEIWKAAGMNLENVEFVLSSDVINSKAGEYWPLVIDIARRNTLARITKCCQIMGRNETDNLSAAQILYPLMQCADVFFLKADICQLGMDQRKVNVLAREYCDDIKRKKKPIILSHHMLPGLREGQEKMSKSDSSSAVFMEDEEAEVEEKIQNAYCPPCIVKGNPCLEYIKYLVFPWFNAFKVERKDEKGGAKVFANYDELVADYEKGDLHPADLKPALSKALNKILQPVRDHFINDEKAKALLKKVKGYSNSKATEESTEQAIQEDEEITTIDEENAGFEDKYNSVRNIAEKCTTDEELRSLFKNKAHPICLDGFEPSGRMTIAQGLTRIINTKKLTDAGCKMKILIGDWCAQLNNKLDGDLKKIHVVGDYIIEVLKAAGINVENVEFLLSSDVINKKGDEYWPIVMDVATRNSCTNILSHSKIMGRDEKDDKMAAQILYPLMQCADVFFLKADICIDICMGMDKKEVNELPRQYADASKRKNKPIILSHHMLLGLKGKEKMSTSDASSAIFMDDEEAEVNVKIKKAYCPDADARINILKNNPCLEYIKYIVFPWFNTFKVERKDENGGAKVFANYDEVVADYVKGYLHPADLKPALSKALNKMLQPVRDHFKTDEKAKALLKKVKGYKVTK